MELNTPRLQLVIIAVQDSIRHTEEMIKKERGDVTDLEDRLILLGTLEADLKAEYEKSRRKDKDLLPYDVLVGKRKFRSV